MQNEHKFSIAISWLTLAYFIILFAERAQSLIRIALSGEVGYFDTGFDIYANCITVVSVLASFVMLVFLNKGFLKSLVDRSVIPDYSMLAITSGVMLVSGMVHTEFTIAPIQFAAYGALIAAMVLRTIENAPKARSKCKLWYSLVYLTFFSMAIPVMYHSHIEHAVLFHIISALAALVLVLFFTVMLRRVFLGTAEDLLGIVPAVVMAAFDAAVVIMRWNEEINMFVLIFAIVTAVTFIIGKVSFGAAAARRKQ